MKTPRLLPLILLSAVIAHADDRQDTALERRLGEYAERVGGTFRSTWLTAAQVIVTDGVDEYEAFVLGSAYLYAHINRCSDIRTLRDDGTRWVAETLVGEPPGDRGPVIFIDKQIGATSSPDNKTVTDPKSYLEFVRR